MLNPFCHFNKNCFIIAYLDKYIGRRKMYISYIELKTPNVESLSQSKWWSSRVELAEIQNELNKAVSSAPNPSKAPLNYIDNMDEREKSQKEHDKKIREKQQELAVVLQASDNKSDEIDVFRYKRQKSMFWLYCLCCVLPCALYNYD